MFPEGMVQVDGNGIVIIALGGALLGIPLLLVALAILVQAAVVASNLLSWAAEYGFAGIAIYVILWVVATPVMFTLCILGGIVRAFAEWSGLGTEEARQTGSHE